MRRFTWLVAAVLLVSLSNCKSGAGPEGGYAFDIEGVLDAPPPSLDSVYLLHNTADQQAVIASAPAQIENGLIATFRLKGKVPAIGIYTLSFGRRIRRNIILGVDERFAVRIRQTQTQLAEFQGSEENTRYYAYLTEGQALMRAYVRLNQLEDPEQRRQIADSAWQAQVALHRKLAPGTKVLPVLFATNEVKPYELAAGSHLTQVDYYYRTLFANDSLQNPTLGYIRAFYEKASSFAQVLVQKGIGDAEALARIDSLSQLMPTGSPQQEVFLLGIGRNLAGRRVLADAVAARYLQAFPQGIAVAEMQAHRDALEGLRPGDQAPAIALPSPEGKTVALSSLRGQYVLIDFWAAWCAPCRRENPNVVRLYNRYRAKGFEIYGVSLDESKEAWQKAIAEDQLPWVHVSDLQGWQSAAAQRYGVQAIPATVLLDKEGKIIAWDLRGEALAEKLAELFEEA